MFFNKHKIEHYFYNMIKIFRKSTEVGVQIKNLINFNLKFFIFKVGKNLNQNRMLSTLIMIRLEFIIFSSPNYNQRLLKGKCSKTDFYLKKYFSDNMNGDYFFEYLLINSLVKRKSVYPFYYLVNRRKNLNLFKIKPNIFNFTLNFNVCRGKNNLFLAIYCSNFKLKEFCLL